MRKPLRRPLNINLKSSNRMKASTPMNAHKPSLPSARSGAKPEKGSPQKGKKTGTPRFGKRVNRQRKATKNLFRRQPRIPKQTKVLRDLGQGKSEDFSTANEEQNEEVLVVGDFL